MALWIHWWMIKWALILLVASWVLRILWPVGEWVVFKAKEIWAYFHKSGV